MATPFVAAAAARRWGYKPLETNDVVGSDVINSGWEVEDSCWDTSMAGKHQVNVASLLDRGAMTAEAYDASSGVPLSGATLMAYQGTKQVGSAVISPSTYTYTSSEVGYPPTVYTNFTAFTDILNLPAGSGYQAKINKSGYTNGVQAAFQHSPFDYIGAGDLYWFGRTGVPPKSANFETVLGWWWWYMDSYNNPDTSDLDLNIWLPNTPNPLDIGQPAPFIVGNEGNSFGFLENDPSGAMTAFPFARLKRDGSSQDQLIENTTVAARAAHAPLSASSALPYYAGTYTILVTDDGQNIDHDSDVGTPNIPVMGVYDVPHIYIWKDGNIKLFVNMSDSGLPVDPYSTCNTHWWEAATITSGVSGVPTYTAVNNCAPNDPYSNPPTPLSEVSK
jgi:hypothetical protein